MATFSGDDLKKLPKFDQTQAALEEQLRLLRCVANRLGFYDAADHLSRK